METFRRLTGGEIRVLGEPRRKLDWHRPSTRVRPIQWQPETGVTRYEWCRSRTPRNQVPFFEHLQRIYRARTPRLLPAEILEKLEGLDGDLREQHLAGFRETVAEHEILTRDPSGEWAFAIRAEVWRGALCDRLITYCTDRHTLPDSELMLRFRSWVLGDDREAFSWMPDQDLEDLGRYDNQIWNSAHLISPRLVQQGSKLPRATQG